MITAVAQALAEILADGTSLIRTEQIDFNHPGITQDVHPRLNLYCYNLRENKLIQDIDGQTPINVHNICPTSKNLSIVWFDISFLVTAWDCTALGEQRLLSEVLTQLLCYRLLPEESLVPELRMNGRFALGMPDMEPSETVALWSALRVPLRPALYVTVSVPVNWQRQPLIPKELSVIQ
jgi:hypothetical protein